MIVILLLRQVAHLKQLVEMQDRLEDISGRLLIKNTDLCQRQLRNILGFSVANKYSYSTANAALARLDSVIIYRS